MNSRLTTAYDTLREDLESLSVPAEWAKNPRSANYMWAHMRSLARDTYLAKRPPEGTRLQTQFARHIVALLESLPEGMTLAHNQKFSRISTCRAAEPRFCAAVKLRGTIPVQTVVLEEKGRPAAILKTGLKDEPSILCVEDSPEHAMHAGVIYVPEASERAYELQQRAFEQSGPSLMALGELPSAVGNLLPIRTTTFALDSELREHMGTALGDKELYSTVDLSIAAAHLTPDRTRALKRGAKILKALTN